MPKRLSVRHLLLATSALAPLGALAALANPLGPNVVGGNSNISGIGTNNVIVNQNSQNTIINWHSFNIGSGERVQFVQPNANASALNRVTGGMGPSSINGVLDANGRIFLVNPNGVLFGRGASVSTAGFLATTSDITDENFMAGRYQFNIAGRPDASIVNNGTITAHSHGFAALVAPGVRNSGTITAHLGTVGLASANSFSLDFYGDQLIKLSPGDAISGMVRDVETGLPLNALVKNEGLLRANGGRVELTAAAARTVVDSVINNTGVIEARSVGSRNGKIVLGAATGDNGYRQTVKVSGKLDVSNKSGKGGKIQVTGQHIEVRAASFDASGTTGGGTVLIGGDTAGGAGNSSVAHIPQSNLEAGAVPNATSVSVDSASVISASAIHVGDGGKVIVWADGHTSFAGHIMATGGMEGGNGGFAEVSGKATLDYTGLTDLRAPHGTWGTLLLDPGNLTIVSGSGGSTTGNDSADSTLGVITLTNALANGNVVVQTGMGTGACSGVCDGDIIVATDIFWSGNSTLTLNAYRHVQFNPNITVSNTNNGSGGLIVRADFTGTGTGHIKFSGFSSGAIIDWTYSTGQVVFYDNPVNGYGSPHNFTAPHPVSDGMVIVNNASQFQYWMLVNNLTDLSDISLNTDERYALGRDISGGSMNGLTFNFSGEFDGLGHSISNLTINGPSLFATNSGTIKNLTLTNLSVAASGNGQNVGLLVGTNAAGGQIVNVHTSGTVNGGNFFDVALGGLVGRNFGTISQSTSSATVTGGNGIANFDAVFSGGLVGINDNMIVSSSASGTVTVGNWALGGGLVGLNNGTINLSSASGAVSSAGIPLSIGGLVGRNASSGFITDSFALGSVTATATTSPNCRLGEGCVFGVLAGGLVGNNEGVIRSVSSPFATYASGTVSVGSNGAAGGLVGLNFGTIDNATSYSIVTGASGTGGAHTLLGGLAGANAGTISDSTASGFVGSASSNFLIAGGLVGVNTNLITGSSASGAVTVGSNSMGGGLVGNNTQLSLFGVTLSGTIDSSSATGNVTSGGTSVMLGGLAGINSAGATITDSFAEGNVMATANLPTSCFFSMGCDYVRAGGLVGYNAGTITSEFADYSTYALGDVYVGSHGRAGGLVGVNTGIIEWAEAYGNVTGASGSSFQHQTLLGGLVGANHGLTQFSIAYGNVGSSGTTHMVAGGAIGRNSGLAIVGAHGSVTTGDSGIAGGAIGVNEKLACTDCPSGDGSAFFNTATATLSYALGPIVTVGSNSVAGGLTGINAGNIADSYTLVGVLGDGNSILGGLTGVNDLGGTINTSFAHGAVVSFGSNSWLGGFVGFNGGTIANSGFGTGSLFGIPLSGFSSVFGGSSSLIGGFAGMNIGTISNSQSDAMIIVAGSGSMVGGFAGANFGSLTGDTATGTVDALGSNIVGGLVGANGALTLPSGAATAGFAPAVAAVTLPNSSFPVGTVTNSNASVAISAGEGSTTGSQIGTSNPASLPGAPSIIADCNAAICTLIKIATLVPTNPDEPRPPVNPIPDEVLAVPNSTFASVQPTTTPTTEVLIQLTQPTDTPSTGAPGTGTSQQQGAPSQVPGTQPASVAPAPAYIRENGLPSGLPPVGETRFNQTQVLVQFPLNVSQEEVNRIAQQFGLSILSSSNSAGGVTVQFQLASGQNVRNMIRALEKLRELGVVQPNYTYTLLQAPATNVAQAVPQAIPPVTAVTPRGDPAQYMMNKLHLPEAHRVSSGSDVSIAVIDSEVDPNHAELSGTVKEQFDATNSPTKPHSHGTAMAGAIVSRDRLLGVAPGARILAVRAFSETQATAESTTVTIIRSIEWAISRGARVINMSFAGPYDPTLERALKDAAAKGVIMIAASGNAGPKSKPLWPSADPNVIAVTATDSRDRLFRMANRGAYVSVASPGVEILAPAPDAGYQMSTGTSIATAHVSGIVALMLERDPSLTPRDVRLILEATASDLGPKGRDVQYGWGLVNPQKALGMVDELKKKRGSATPAPAAAPAPAAPVQR